MSAIDYWDDINELEEDDSTLPQFNRVQQSYSNPYAVVPYMQRISQEKRDQELGWGDYFDAAWTGAAHGFTTYGPEQLYRAARTLARMVGAQGIEQWAAEGIQENILEREKDPWYRPDPRWMESGWGKALYGGFSSFVSSSMSYLPGASLGLLASPVAAGAGLGALLFSGMGMLAGSSASAAIAGLAEYDSFMDEALSAAQLADPSITYDKLAGEQFWLAVASAVSEIGTEFIGDMVAGKMSRLLPGSTKLGSKLSSVLGKYAADPVAGVLGRTVNRITNNIATELGEEAANAMLQDWLKQSAGLSHQGRLAALQNIIGPTIVSGALGGVKNSLAGEVSNQIGDFSSSEVALRAASMERKKTLLSPEAGELMSMMQVSDPTGPSYETALVLDAISKRTSSDNNGATNYGEVLKTFDPQSQELKALIGSLRNKDSKLEDVIQAGFAFLQQQGVKGGENGLNALLQSFLIQDEQTGEVQVDGQKLLQTFQGFVKTNNLENVPESAREGFQGMRNVLQDAAMALDGISTLRPSEDTINALRSEDYKRPRERSLFMDDVQVKSVLKRWEGKDLTNKENLDAFLIEALPGITPNFANVDADTGDIKGIVEDMTKAYQPLIEQIRMNDGTKPWQEALGKAKETLSQDYPGLLETIREVYGRVERLDEKQAEIGLVLVTAEAHEKALMKYVVEADAFDSDMEFQLMALSDNLAAMRKADKGIGREEARAFNIRKLSKADPKYQELREKMLQARNGPMNVRRARLEAIVNSPTGKVADEINKRTLGSRVMDAVIEWATSSMLSSPSTHVVNTLGNTLMGGARIFERTLAEKFMPATQGGVASGEVLGATMGLWEGLVNVKTLWKSYRGQYDPGMQGMMSAIRNSDNMWGADDSTKNFEAGTMRRAVSGESLGLSKEHGMISKGLSHFVDLLGSISHVPFALLGHEDGVFKSAFASSELRALLVREAGGDRLRLEQLIQNPPRDLVAQATQEAKHLVFQDNLGKFAQNLDRMRNEQSWLRFFLPFLKTPINIFMEGISLTPIVNKMIGNIPQQLKSPDPAQRQLAEAHVMLGTFLWTTALTLASAGYLTGPGPEDPEKARRKSATGWLPNALRIGEDQFMQIDRLDPLALIFNGAGMLVEAVDHLDDEDKERGWLMGIGQGIRAVLSRTYMRSLNDVMDLIMRPERGYPSLERRLGSVLWPGAALGRVFNRTHDEYMRMSEGFWDGLRDSIPGLSSSLPLRRDFLGQPIKTNEQLGPDWLSPFRISEKSSSPLHLEVARLQEFAGLSAAPTPGRTIQYQGRTVRLQGAEYGDYLDRYGNKVTLNGKNAQQTLNKLINSSEYKRMNDQERAKTIRNTLSRFQREAKREVLATNPRLQKAFQIKGQQQQSNSNNRWNYLLGQ